jgi:hypothetical protein
MTFVLQVIALAASPPIILTDKSLVRYEFPCGLESSPITAAATPTWIKRMLLACVLTALVAKDA